MTPQSDPNVQSIYCIIFGHMYKYVSKHPFRQDDHDRLNMDLQLPYFYTDNFSR